MVLVLVTIGVSIGIKELVLLYHCRSLCPQCADGLEDIYDSLVLHSLQNNWQRDEDAGPADASTGKEKLGCEYLEDDNDHLDGYDNGLDDIDD